MVDPDSTEGDQPDAQETEPAGPDGLDQPGIRAFLIADIRGYTQFTDEHGDEAAAALTDRFATLTVRVVRSHDGRVLELRGDEALAVFSSSRQALRAALALQAAFSDVPEAERLPVGIGLDAGEAVPIQGGFRGAPLNRAGLAVTYVYDGHLHTTRITDDRLQLTGQAPGTVRTYTYFPQLKGDHTTPDRRGLVRMPQFDWSAADARFQDRFNSRLCR